MIERSATLASAQTITVFPAYFPDILEQLDDAAPENDSNASHWTLRKNENLHGLREFSPGDRVAWIDWKTTAKTGTMMTREFENSALSRISVGFFGADDPNFEYALRAAYSFSRKLLEQNNELRITLFGTEIETFDFGRGSKHLHEISQAFAEIKPQKVDILLAPFEKELKESGALLLFVPRITKTLTRQIQKLADKKVILISIYEPEENQPNVIYLHKDLLTPTQGGES
ncbi:hypothetical protein MFLO_14107 [Listeria floridensis FSL S10-1187]|uniref:DUF58 domain-containing protein n=2 Tax=Listeria floridensis TaxID=1494962 RepID=A0ABN0RC41_9LIST|nr:hypothetical protein MFLO_14107 [Listeria floridensis FSL S10-1187]